MFEVCQPGALIICQVMLAYNFNIGPVKKFWFLYSKFSWIKLKSFIKTLQIRFETFEFQFQSPVYYEFFLPFKLKLFKQIIRNAIISL